MRSSEGAACWRYCCCCCCCCRRPAGSASDGGTECAARRSLLVFPSPQPQDPGYRGCDSVCRPRRPCASPSARLVQSPSPSAARRRRRRSDEPPSRQGPLGHLRLLHAAQKRNHIILSDQGQPPPPPMPPAAPFAPSHLGLCRLCAD